MNRIATFVTIAVSAVTLAPAGTPELDWQKVPGVLVDNEIPGVRDVFPGAVIALPDGGFRMFYEAGDGWTHSDTRAAFSLDGIEWTDEGLVLEHGCHGTGYDAVNANVSDVITLPDGTLRAYYVGFDSTGTDNRNRILSAVSTDLGLSWVCDAGVRIEPTGVYEDPWVLDPELVPLPDGRWRMYYLGAADRTDYRVLSAVSTDAWGLDWIREDVVYEPGTHPDGLDAASSISGIAVTGDDASGYRLLYVGHDGVQHWVLSASSADGLAFTVDPEYRFTLGEPGEPDSVSIAKLTAYELDPGYWMLYYGGNDTTGSSPNWVVLGAESFGSCPPSPFAFSLTSDRTTAAVGDLVTFTVSGGQPGSAVELWAIGINARLTRFVAGSSSFDATGQHVFPVLVPGLVSPGDTVSFVAVGANPPGVTTSGTVAISIIE